MKIKLMMIDDEGNIEQELEGEAIVFSLMHGKTEKGEEVSAGIIGPFSLHQMELAANSINEILEKSAKTHVDELLRDLATKSTDAFFENLKAHAKAHKS